jgi:hypothetical protein
MASRVSEPVQEPGLKSEPFVVRQRPVSRRSGANGSTKMREGQRRPLQKHLHQRTAKGLLWGIGPTKVN